MKLKSLLLTLSLFFSISVLAGHHEDPSAESVEKELREYVKDFMAKDYLAIASHFRAPMMYVGFGGTFTFSTEKEIVSMYKNMMSNIQEGYAYSTTDRIDVTRMSSTTYAADMYFTRYNAADGKIFEGRSIYMFGNQKGAWKMFSIIQAERE